MPLKLKPTYTLSEALERYNRRLRSKWSREADEVLRNELGIAGLQWDDDDTQSLPVPAYTEEVIRRFCTRFRFRFLIAGAYKGQYPPDAISLAEVMAMDTERFTGKFYVAAPQSFFQRRGNRNSLLFAQQTDGRFRLIYAWGNRFSLFRLLLAFPYRNFNSMFYFSASIGGLVVIAFFLMGWLHDENWLKNILLKIPIWILTTGFMLVISVIYGLITYTEFSEDSWRSRQFRKMDFDT